MLFLPTGVLRAGARRVYIYCATCFTRQTLGLALPGDFGEVPAKIWYLQKVEK